MNIAKCNKKTKSIVITQKMLVLVSAILFAKVASYITSIVA